MIVGLWIKRANELLSYLKSLLFALQHDETPKKLAADQGDKGIIRLLDLDPSKAREVSIN